MRVFKFFCLSLFQRIIVCSFMKTTLHDQIEGNPFSPSDSDSFVGMVTQNYKGTT